MHSVPVSEVVACASERRCGAFVQLMKYAILCTGKRSI